MSLEIKVMDLMKEAMKAKNEGLLRGLRAIKAEIIKCKTEPGFNGSFTEELEIKILNRLLKQRQDSLKIFQEQNRSDLAQKEQEEIEIIQQFLPQQLSETEIETHIKSIARELNINSKAEVGKLIGAVNKKLAGKASGSLIAKIAQGLFA